MAKKKVGSHGLARLTLSIPAELKTRLDEAATSGFSLNLSRLATSAFEDELNRLNRLKVSADLQLVVDRLLAIERMPPLGFEMGYVYGRMWAAHDAYPNELRRMEALAESEKWSAFVKDNSGISLSDRLYFEVMDQQRSPNGEAAFFWKQYVPVEVSKAGIRLDQLSDEFFRGFVEGAMSIWHEVKDHVQSSVNLNRRSYAKRSREPK